MKFVLSANLITKAVALLNVVDVVEMVDTQDLGSCDQKSWGFKSPRPHHCFLLFLMLGREFVVL